MLCRSTGENILCSALLCASHPDWSGSELPGAPERLWVTTPCRCTIHASLHCASPGGADNNKDTAAHNRSQLPQQLTLPFRDKTAAAWAYTSSRRCHPNARSTLRAALRCGSHRGQSGPSSRALPSTGSCSPDTCSPFPAHPGGQSGGRSRRTCRAAHRRLPRRRRPGRLPRGQAAARTTLLAAAGRLFLRGALRRPPPPAEPVLAAAPPPQGGEPGAGLPPPATRHGKRYGGTASTPPPPAPPFCRGARRDNADWPPSHRAGPPLAPQREGGPADAAGNCGGFAAALQRARAARARPLARSPSGREAVRG